jgi:hypothetical protein
LLFKVDGGLQLGVLLLLVVEVLHVGFMRLLVLVLCRLMLHLLVDMVGWLLALMFVL